jgi:alpha-glucosidase (family GH31 glycosyl hydrolase)
MFGNPFVVHEACGYSRFSPNPSLKIKEKEKDSKFTEELCVRWLQSVSLGPYARLNDFELLPIFKEETRKAAEKSFKLRAVMNMYIYAYMIKNGLDVIFFIFNYRVAHLFVRCSLISNQKI